jgi:hypothetical protein
LCPGNFGDIEYYDAYTFRNGPVGACISVTLNAPAADLFSAAYLSTFSPTNACATYLADSGDSTLTSASYNGQRTYSFNMPANTVFVVTVNGVYGSAGPYALSVTGGSCQPALSINPAGVNQVALKWTTAAGGYVLESTNRVANVGANWQPVTALPLVSGGQFVVTNTVYGSNLFYRLRKP